MNLQILQGSALDRLRELPSNSVDCCCSSPPYWGLRDYGVDGQLGLEATPQEFVATLVEVYLEVFRVLKPTGTCWVNLGDSYAGSWGAQSRGNTNGEASSTLGGSSPLQARSISAHPLDSTGVGSMKRTPGLKPKDLVGIPWRVAFALQDSGWYLRQDIIWSKPNPMPESMRDRCTRAHEYIFLLAKSERYFYDQDAVSEPVSPNTHLRLSQDVAAQIGSERANGGAKTNGNMKAVGKVTPAGSGVKNNESFAGAVCLPVTKRNRRSVWEIVTQSYSGAHFATFPEEIPRLCILAGCPEGGTVLDPFLGSGTTLAVAKNLGRNGIGIELNPEYIELAKKRIADAQAPLCEVAA